MADKTLTAAIAGPDDVRASGPVAIILILVLAFVVGLNIVLIALSRRKKVVLSSEAARLEEEILQDKEDLKMTDNEKTRQAIQADIELLSNDVLKHRETIDELDKRHEQLKTELTAVNSWDDLVVKAPK